MALVEESGSEPSVLRYEPSEDRNWVIKKNSEVIYQASGYSKLDIARWGDWLLMDNYSDNADARLSQLHGYNIKTGELKIFFTEENAANYINSIFVVNNKSTKA